METIRFEHEGRLLAVKIAAPPSAGEGFQLATPNGFGIQVGRNRRPAGHVARAHYHPRQERIPEMPRQEVLHVLRGRVRVALFTEEGEAAGVVEAGPGETLFLAEGHEVAFVEDTELLEVKQGPYPGPEWDKVWLSES